MAKENLFTRNDTIFGVCQGLGEDLGFNPLWLRLALILPIFWFPFHIVAAYLALGLVVLVSRLAFGDRAAQPATVPASTEKQLANIEGDSEELSQAA